MMDKYKEEVKGNRPRQFTKDEAVNFHDSKAYEDMTDQERALFQINQEKLCMPFDVFHSSVEKTLGRPVWTHLFGDSGFVERMKLDIRKAYVDSLEEKTNV